MPSPLNSPTATECGPEPAGKVSAGWNVPSPLPSRTEVVVEAKFAVATSSRPSRLKSPLASAQGFGPAAKTRAAWKVPSPLPSSTATFAEP